MFVEEIRNKRCVCLNGGTCIDVTQGICECVGGYEGSRCEETFIDFTFAERIRRHPEILGAILFAVFLVVVVAIGCCVVWRRCSRIKKEKERESHRITRRQSKATIEGSSFIEQRLINGVYDVTKTIDDDIIIQLNGDVISDVISDDANNYKLDNPLLRHHESIVIKTPNIESGVLNTLKS
ncbi:uncharacterized protein LOC144749818 [Ciona intestinalis]